MKVSLRKAAALQEAITEAINDINHREFDTRIDVLDEEYPEVALDNEQEKFLLHEFQLHCLFALTHTKCFQ